MTYKTEAKASQATKAKRMIGAETDTAHKIAEAEGSQTSIADRAKKLARVCGGKVTGNAAAKRLDKPARARGGAVKGKGKTTVNVIVSPQGGQNGGAPPAMVLPPAPSPVAPPMPAGGVPPVPPAGTAPMGPRPPVPTMRAAGGAVKAAQFHVYDRQTGNVVGGADTRSRARLTANKKDTAYGAVRYGVRPNPDHPDNKGVPDTGFQRGGRVKMDAGAGSGLGRLQKAAL